MRAIPILLAIPLLLECTSRSNVDELNLAVRWELETNQAEGGGHGARFTITNNSNLDLTSDNWALYWNMAPRSITPGSLTAPVTIEWINGDFYVMKPRDGFRLARGDQMEIEYRGSYAIIKESDAPTGLYFVLATDNGTQRAYPVREYAIAPFERADQINRDQNDREPIPTAEWLFDTYADITDIPDDQVPLILPTPRRTTRGNGAFTIDGGTVIGYESGLESEASLLAAALADLLNRPISTREGTTPGQNNIHLQHREVMTPGAYDLSIAPTSGVTISGDESGVFYGSQSLQQLISTDYLGRTSDSIHVPAVHVEDAPSFEYRGMHLDVARNFHSVESVKHLLDAMALYKLNRLHLHLTEDEGWRIAIAALPELTEIGAFRGHTTDDSDHLQPSYGSGPFADSTTGHGSGFYSRQQYIDLLQYAWDRHIEVIPEINMPGHSRAAIKAMEARYRRLMDEGNQPEAERYRLADPDDASAYRSAQWYTDNVISVCRESAFTFETTVLDELIAMHQEARVPLAMIHTGGDEVPTGAWSKSPICATYLESHPEIDNPKNLQKAFFKRIRAYLDSKGIQTGGWEEIAMNFRADGSWTPNNEFAGGGVIPFIWNSLQGAEDLGNRLANAGYPVVLSNVTNFYFDLAYNKDPREPGLYWGGFVNTRDAFEFVPFNVFRSMRTTPNGDPYTDANFAGMETLTARGRQNILGMQGQLWSETLKGQDMLEYYYLPKMLGLAERAWVGQAAWGDIANRVARTAAVDRAWNVFANTVAKREFPRLDRWNGGYNYRLAPPGAKAENGRLVVNTAYPGVAVRYTVDGSDPTTASRLYSQPLELGADVVKLSTFDSRGRASLPTIVRRTPN